MKSSLVERLSQAKKALGHVKTVVTSVDGSCTVVERCSDGSFNEVDDNGDIDDQDSKLTTLEDSSKSHEVPSSISKRRLKKVERLRRYGFVVDLALDLQMANVASNVYLGSQDVAHSLELLLEYKITHIVNCATGIANIYEGKFKYLNVEVLDIPDVNIREYFDEVHQFMRTCVEAGGNVFVHCNAGISRSATIVLSYIMRYERVTLNDALKRVREIRNVSPNPGFMQQLKLYEEELCL
uniref:Dual specificity protein phosphatase n=1 Tax=Syphacia muris TaxID=451379 RepID=A0A0N5AB85_9BILA